MQTMGDRLKMARENLHLTQAELAARGGVLQQAVNRIETGRVKNPRQLAAIAKAAGVSEAFLRFGIADGDNFGPAPEPKQGMVPVISWVAAGGFEDIDEVTEVEEWRPCPPCGMGPQAFGLRVAGDSMESGQGLSIPSGAIIFVDPDARVENGSLVVARSEGRATFKQYVEDSGVKYLKPLNPRYPLYQMEEGDEIVGAVKSYSFDL